MGKRTKILLVDSNVDFVEKNRTFLENNGYDVVTAGCSADGLELAKLERPDLIILELMMEKHNAGLVCVEALKSDPNLRHIPVLMLTGVAEATGFRFSQEQDGYWMKTDDFADKPLLPEELLTRIKQLLGKAGVDRR